MISIGGIYLLSINENMRLSVGDILLLLCALVFSFHILAIDAYSPKVNGIALSCIQLLVGGMISIILSFIFEQPDLTAIRQAWFPLLYTGILSSGIAYTLQIMGQRYVKPSAAPVIMSMEAVFAAIAGWLILNQTMQTRELLGCVLVLIAVLMAQIPAKKQKI